jgi:hypothetical protein
MFRILYTFLFISLFINAFPQQAANWKNYTDMKNITDVKVNANGLWAATSGGGFFYNSDGTFTTLNKIDGINSISLSAVAVDNEGKIWFGSSDGTISIYDPLSKSIKTILDIFNSGRASNEINDMRVSGDTIIISHNFGVSLVDANNMVFYDTFIKFGNLSSNIKVNSAFKSDLFYVCTLYGLAIQKLGSTNLSAPESWNVFDNSSGLPSNNVLKVVIRH